MLITRHDVLKGKVWYLRCPQLQISVLVFQMQMVFYLTRHQTMPYCGCLICSHIVQYSGTFRKTTLATLRMHSKLKGVE